MDTASPPRTKPSRDRLLETAGRLFYTRGINSTGIDLVIAEAGVAKGSMYHHFASKQALVIAYLHAEECAWKEAAEAADRSTLSSPDRIAIMFTTVADAVDAGTFHGCPFTNAAIERPDDAEIREIIAHYRRIVASHIVNLLGVGIADPLISQLMLLYDGALTSAKQTGGSSLVTVARSLAQDMVRHKLQPVTAISGGAQ